MVVALDVNHGVSDGGGKDFGRQAVTVDREERTPTPTDESKDFEDLLLQKVEGFGDACS